jgi:ATP-dependent helicase/nuclease subunit B
VIAHAVRHLLDRFQPALPNLNSIAVFLPNNSASQNFRAQLLSQLPASCNHAVIPPWTGTLNEWINEFIQLPESSLTVISEQTRRLMMIEALQQYPSLFKQENKWQVTLALLKLFDELNLHNATVSKSADDWLDSVQRAYGIDHQHEHLQQEASLVHTLWHAWHDQLHASNLLDNSSAYIAKLRAALNQLPNDFYCYVTNIEQLAPCEKDFIQLINENEKCCIIEDSARTPEETINETQRFIKNAFAFQDSPLKKRAENFKNSAKLSRQPFSLFFAQDAELEARAVDIQIREWLLNGKKCIGVVSEDRKLSRRLRALLERADVPLQDMAGWSLSTTSAAAVLERWLECIEEDFDHRPLLDLLKSHFFSSKSTHEEHLENVYRLERDIIHHENIGHGLTRYNEHLRRRQKKLGHWPRDSYNEISELLDHLKKCSESLLNLHHSKYKHTLKQFIETLIESLALLGINDTFQQDPAGIKITQTLNSMHQGLAYSNPKLGWDDFRTWLGLSLEEQLFSPPTKASPVQLMSLEQARLKKFDGLIIAAADNQHMPGSAESSPFFNQGARESLGLETWEQKRNQRLKLFHQLLCSSPEVLITCKAEEQGEAIPLSPWVEALQNFHQLSYGISIENVRLHDILKQHSGVFICDTNVLPTPAEQPSPGLPEKLTPKRISAGAHQRLVNCPYQFFSADALKLKPSEEISEELQKSDYGERVHLILQAFHQQIKSFPEPFKEKITSTNRQAAIDHLSDLSEKVFKKDLEDNTLHRSWRHRWLKHVPGYIDWQIMQQENWDVSDAEIKLEKTLSDNTAHETTIFGRIDRIDTNYKHHDIIDYKTGRSARQQDVDSGEDVQLATYALLDEHAEKVSYLSLDEKEGGVKTGAIIQGEELGHLKHSVSKRLQTMLEMANNGHALTAWGDAGVCSYCNFEGLCRRVNWKG